MTMMTPVLALAAWSMIVLFWMASKRLPVVIAEAKKGNAPPKRTQDMSYLPDQARWLSDNYTHLHEQPVVFYAVCVYSHLVGVADEWNIGLAWAYVVLRIIHSLIQGTSNAIIWRFRTFILSSLLLVVLIGRNIWALVVV